MLHVVVTEPLNSKLCTRFNGKKGWYCTAILQHKILDQKVRRLSKCGISALCHTVSSTVHIIEKRIQTN